MIIVTVQDGEFEYGDQMILGWDGDPKDELGILMDYTGDTSLKKAIGVVDTKANQTIDFINSML